MATIIRLDVVAAKQGDVVTVRNGEDVLENGAFIALGALDNLGLGRATRKVEKLKEGCQLAYLADPAFQYDENKTERDYQLLAGKTARAYKVVPGESITIATSHVEGEVEVGDMLEIKATDYKLQKKDTGVAVAVVLEKCDYEGQESLYIEFI